jgi:hypothetical protein
LSDAALVVGPNELADSDALIAFIGLAGFPGRSWDGEVGLVASKEV